VRESRARQMFTQPPSPFFSGLAFESSPWARPGALSAGLLLVASLGAGAAPALGLEGWGARSS
jgi:hypothetical protein